MDPVDVTTFPETEGAPMRRLTGGRPDGADAAVTPPQAVPASDEHCAECGAPMASDQRYCVECGERRGERRFPAALQPSAAAAPAATPASGDGRRSRMSSSTTLIAGVGTLLLAMGVGVLIGRSGNGSSGRSGAGVQVLTVGSATGTATTGTTGTGTTAATGAARSSTAKGASSKAAIKAPPKSSLPPPTVTVGSKGSGKGYKNGHFTGEFFPSGE